MDQRHLNQYSNSQVEVESHFGSQLVGSGGDVDLRGGQPCVVQKVLDLDGGGSLLDQVGGEGVAFRSGVDLSVDGVGGDRAA